MNNVFYFFFICIVRFVPDKILKIKPQRDQRYNENEKKKKLIFPTYNFYLIN